MCYYTFLKSWVDSKIFKILVYHPNPVYIENRKNRAVFEFDLKISICFKFTWSLELEPRTWSLILFHQLPSPFSLTEMLLACSFVNKKLPTYQTPNEVH